MYATFTTFARQALISLCVVSLQIIHFLYEPRSALCMLYARLLSSFVHKTITTINATYCATSLLHTILRKAIIASDCALLAFWYDTDMHWWIKILNLCRMKSVGMRYVHVVPLVPLCFYYFPKFSLHFLDSAQVLPSFALLPPPFFRSNHNTWQSANGNTGPSTYHWQRNPDSYRSPTLWPGCVGATGKMEGA